MNIIQVFSRRELATSLPIVTMPYSYRFSLKFLHIAIVFLPVLFFSCKENGNSETSQQTVTPSTPKTTLFEKVAPQQSHLEFSNLIREDVGGLENLFDFDYFYNGAGVGMEDLNNDGLLDIFFCGNQVDNKLYVNKGDLSFEDISATAGINVNKKWANGISFVDINNDGWKDIYISQGGPNNRDSRNNLLFINNKDLTFTEQGQAYGLADPGISTQSAFFDFDKDGDLDCIVMNENELYGVDPINLYRLIAENPEAQYYNSSHLYRNDGGHFVDITKKAGLERPIFGLGLSVSDVDNDGFLDIYISSDYYIPDALFINNGNGTFTDRIKEFTNHTSFFGMGVDIADINNDNLQDIFVLDMASKDHFRSKTLMASMNTARFDYLVNKADFHYQYMYNSLQLNIGNGKFNNISQLTETANTDWSWSAILSDFDSDGHKDIFITNGYRRYALDNDLQRKVFNTRKKYGNNVPLAIKEKLYDQMPSEKLANIMYKNKQQLQFEDVAQEWGLDDFSFSNGAAAGDLDNDGDLDLVVNNMDENAFLYRNLTSDTGSGNYLKVKTSGVTSEPFARIKISYGNTSQFIESKRIRGYMSSHDNTAHFGLGSETMIDTIQVQWSNGKVEERYQVNANSTIEFNITDATSPISSKKEREKMFQKLNKKNLGLNVVHQENFYDDFEKEILLPYKQSGLGPFITKADINGDGKTDVFIGGATGQAGQLYIQTSNGFKKLTSKVLENDKGHEDMEAVFFDIDQDNDMDLYVVSGGNEFEENSSFYADRVYLNNGKGNFTKLHNEILTSFPKSGKTVSAIDFDKDGDMDLLVGNRMVPKKYPTPSASVLYENKGGQLVVATSEKAVDFENFGIINSLITTDFNNDGWQDFIAVGEWTGIGFFENKQGTFHLITKENDLLQEKGWWYSVRETDLNNDGLKDYIVGNVGLNLKFHTSKEKPFRIHATDFDGNGSNDIVLSKEYKGRYVPVRGRECTSQQMPFIQEKFPSYKEFASATLSDIYGEKLASSYSKEANEFQSILLMNMGNGRFEKQLLPIETQAFPILDAVFMDLNKDGFEDCILAGNIYETEVETPRLDAISGTVLLSNGKDGYFPMKHSQTGLYLEGNVRDLELIGIGNKKYLLKTANNDAMSVFKISDP